MRLAFALLLEAQPWVAVLLLGVAVGVVAFAFIGLVVFFHGTPTGATRIHEAQVVGLGLVETDEGSYPRARARLPSGHEVTVRIRRAEACAVGDRIRIQEMPVRWGRRYSATLEGCLR